MTQYVVITYVPDKPTGCPEEGSIKIMNEKQVFELLSEHRNGDKLFAVHQLGDCVLDWS